MRREDEERWGRGWKGMGGGVSVVGLKRGRHDKGSGRFDERGSQEERLGGVRRG